MSRTRCPTCGHYAYLTKHHVVVRGARLRSGKKRDLVVLETLDRAKAFAVMNEYLATGHDAHVVSTEDGHVDGDGE